MHMIAWDTWSSFQFAHVLCDAKEREIPDGPYLAEIASIRRLTHAAQSGSVGDSRNAEPIAAVNNL
jgi:hypothetical protein